MVVRSVALSITYQVVKTAPTYYVYTIYLPISPLFFYLPIYILDLLLIEWVTKMKPGSNSVEDHPQLSHNRHPMDGALVGVGSLWPTNMINDIFQKKSTCPKMALLFMFPWTGSTKYTI
jgi:hypothetical protein